MDLPFFCVSAKLNFVFFFWIKAIKSRSNVDTDKIIFLFAYMNSHRMFQLCNGIVPSIHVSWYSNWVFAQFAIAKRCGIKWYTLFSECQQVTHWMHATNSHRDKHTLISFINHGSVDFAIWSLITIMTSGDKYKLSDYKYLRRIQMRAD